MEDGKGDQQKTKSTNTCECVLCTFHLPCRHSCIQYLVNVIHHNLYMTSDFSMCCIYFTHPIVFQCEVLLCMRQLVLLFFPQFFFFLCSFFTFSCCISFWKSVFQDISRGCFRRRSFDLNKQGSISVYKYKLVYIKCNTNTR